MPLTPSEKQRRYRERKKREKMEAEAAAGETAASVAPADEPLPEQVVESGPSEITAASGLGEHVPEASTSSEAPTEDPDQGEAVAAESANGEDPVAAHDADDAVLAEQELVQTMYEIGLRGEPGPPADFPKLQILAWAQGVWMRHALKEQATMPAEKLDGRAARAREYAEFYEHRLEGLPEPLPQTVVSPDPATAAAAAKRSSWDG